METSTLRKRLLRLSLIPLLLVAFTAAGDKFTTVTASQSMGIGTTSPNSKAALDIVSTTKGVLDSRMTTTQRDAITSVPEALRIYNTTTHYPNFWNGSTWKQPVTSGDIVNADVAAGAAIAYSKLNLALSIVNADVAIGAAIGRLKIASGTPSQVVINDGAGALSSVANLTVPNGGSGAGTFTAHGVLLGEGTSAFGVTAAGSAGQVLQSGGASADPTYSTPTYPSASGTSGKILRSDGTNNVYSGFTIPDSGTSGGIPYYSSTTALSSSALLAANQVMIGGGAGAAPSTLAAGSQYQVLRMGAANPAYGSINLDQAAAVTGVLPNANTTATSANTASTIVARDSSGNFTAGTVTAAVTGTASGNTTYTPNNHGMILSSATNAMTVVAPDASTSKIWMSGGASADPAWGSLVAGSNITLTPAAGQITIAASSTATPAYTYVSQATTLNPAVIGSYYLLSGASFTITLPTAASIAGQSIIFQHNGTSLTQVYTFNTTSSQTINWPGGTAASAASAMYTNGEKVVLYSDGSNWQVVQHDTRTAEADAGALTYTASSAHSFTIVSASITAGTTYSTPNGCKFVVSTTSAASVTLLAYGTCAPNAAANTLTYVSGPTAGDRAYSAVSNAGQPVKGTVTYERFIWTRDGEYVSYRYDYAWSGAVGTAGTGDIAIWLPTNLQPDETNMGEQTAVLGAAYPTSMTVIGRGFAHLSGAPFDVYLHLSWPGLLKGICQGGGTLSAGACNPLTSSGRASYSGRYRVTGWRG